MAVILFLSSATYSQNWELIWADEFNYNGLPDSTKWDYEDGYIRNHESQYYAKSRLENTRVEDGNLIIEARKEKIDTVNYSSGSIHTKHKGDWVYGKFEIRAKLPKGVGMWPAIWMIATNNEYGEWPHYGEIDIMESIGYDPYMIYMTSHTGMFNGAKGTQLGCKTKIENIYEDFHTYKVEWVPDKLDFFVDDIRYFSYPKASEDKEIWPYDKLHYLILNIAVGGEWGGIKGIDDSIFPQKMLVDYVRVYQLK